MNLLLFSLYLSRVASTLEHDQWLFQFVDHEERGNKNHRREKKERREGGCTDRCNDHKVRGDENEVGPPLLHDRHPTFFISPI